LRRYYGPRLELTGAGTFDWNVQEQGGCPVSVGTDVGDRPSVEPWWIRKETETRRAGGHTDEQTYM